MSESEKNTDHKACHEEPAGENKESSSHQQPSCHEKPKHTSSCCPPEQDDAGCHDSKGKPDFLLWGSLAVVAILYLHYFLHTESTEFSPFYQTMAHSVFELINTMWLGVLLGITMVALLSKVPRDFVMSILGTRSGFGGILRATAAGVLLDLCSHGILMVGAKLYERGASIGQVMAFLIASPWNSFSLTLVLIALIGLPWTLAFIVFSMLIAVIAGVIFDMLVGRGVLPANASSQDLPDNFRFIPEAKKSLAATTFNGRFFYSMAIDGVKESRMVLRWLFFGVVLASIVRAVMTPDAFQDWFGPSMVGLAMTIIAATIIEVCSEGSAPIAADLLTRANAPGNSFAFLMTGVSTDYTEIMVIRDTTRSWKIALFLPLLTVPQVIFIAWLMNGVS